MATTKKSAKNPHTPVSNHPPAVARPRSAAKLSQSPSNGRQRNAKAMTKGLEPVPGFKPLQRANLKVKLQGFKQRDIGEASFGPRPIRPLTVNGEDNRVQIADTGSYLWPTIASLLITAADDSMWIGTGWFIGPKTLITAGHCVFIKNSGTPGQDGWVKQITVVPGRNGSDSPFGQVTSSDFHAVTGWTEDGSEEYDYSAIILSTDLGNQTGWFGFGTYADDDLISAMANIAGYPGDKPDGSLWYDAHQIDSVKPKKVYYDIDTMGGQSGSGVWREIEGSRYAVAIDAYGGTSTNSGTRIDDAVYQNMLDWKNL